MTEDRTRDGDWNRTQWKGEGQDPGPDDRTALDDGIQRAADELNGDQWTKTQWVGEGQGSAGPADPDLMEEGENALSGDRHGAGEDHWARGQSDTNLDADTELR